MLLVSSLVTFIFISCTVHFGGIRIIPVLIIHNNGVYDGMCNVSADRSMPGPRLVKLIFILLPPRVVNRVKVASMLINECGNFLYKLDYSAVFDEFFISCELGLLPLYVIVSLR
jgi:hypothetical protein